MKLLFINVLYSPFTGGGAELTIKELTEGLKNLGCEVKVLSFWDKDDKEEVIDGIPVYRAKIPNLYLPYGKIRHPFLERRLWHILDVYNPISKKIVLKQLKDFKPDVVQIHNTQGWSCSVWDAVAELDVPSLQVLHDLYLLCPTNMFKNNITCKSQCSACKVLRLPCKSKSNKLKAVVGVSNFIIDKYLSYGYFRDVRIKKVIHNSTEAGIINERKTDPRYINFGFIGTLAPNKGVEILLRAYHNIKKPSYRLYIAGTGKENYEKYIKSKYKDETVTFIGMVDQKTFFQKVDVTIVPSIWYESLGRVVIESFAYGIPVIGSNIGGIPEMITEGVNGILFDPYKEGDLEENMLKFESEITEWRTKTEIIKQSASKFQDRKEWLKQWLEMVSMLLEGN